MTKKKILDILITVDLYKYMDFILSTCKVIIYYKTESIDKVTNMYSLYISLFLYLFILFTKFALRQVGIQ